jgi:hypothetical protein
MVTNHQTRKFTSNFYKVNGKAIPVTGREGP